MRNTGKLLSIPTLLLCLVSLCLAGSEKRKISPALTVLGDVTRPKAWVYLCGLTLSWDATTTRNNRALVDRIAKKEHIKIIALKPPLRCAQFKGKLCWPHNTSEQVKQTLAYIQEAVPLKKIAGFIGFSNGGFFLNRLYQDVDVDCSFISIGSGGFLNAPQPNAQGLYLIIGKQDKHHYKLAQHFYKKAQQSPKAHVELLEHDGEHIIPERLLQNLLHRLKN